MGFLYLIGAIASEVVGSSMMKLTAISNSKKPILGIVAGYAASFYLLSLSLLTIPLSFAYGVWAGVGTALTAFVGFLVFKEKVQIQTIIGIILLIIGLVLMRI